MPKRISYAYDPLSSGGKRYPFELMNVGDWMYADSSEQAQRICSAANGYGCKKNTQGFKCSSKKNGPGYWRVTRIA